MGNLDAMLVLIQQRWPNEYVNKGEMTSIDRFLSTWDSQIRIRVHAQKTPVFFTPNSIYLLVKSHQRFPRIQFDPRIQIYPWIWPNPWVQLNLWEQPKDTEISILRLVYKD